MESGAFFVSNLVSNLVWLDKVRDKEVVRYAGDCECYANDQGIQAGRLRHQFTIAATMLVDDSARQSFGSVLNLNLNIISFISRLSE